MIGLMPFVPPSGGAALTLFSDTTGTTYPAGLQNGDMGVLLEALEIDNGYSSPGLVPGLSVLSGWTQLVARTQGTQFTGPGENAETRYGGRRTKISSRSLTAALSSTSIGSNATARRLLVFRHPAGLTLEMPTMKVAETTSGYSGAVSFAAQPNPILPLFCVACAAGNPTSLTFDGSAPSLFDVDLTGSYCRVGLLMGPQPPRSITVALGAAAGQEHAMFNIRRPLS